MTRQTPTSKIQDGRAAEPASLAGEEQRALLLDARMLSAGPSAPAGGQLAALGRIRAAASQFMQVPSSFSQSPQSFSRPLAPTSAYQTMPADLSRPAASSSTPGRAEPGPSDAIGGLMASALAQHHRQQQSLFSQFSSLHSLSAVATAMHHHQHLQNHHNQNHSTHNTLAPAQASLQRGPFEGPLNAGPPFSQFAAQPPSQPPATPASWRPAGARRKRRGARKCRKVYGMAQRDVWCTQCKWKKACSRFAANQLVALEGAGGALAHKSPRLQAGAGATQAGPAQANGAEQLMSSLLDMSASFRRLQEAAQPPPSITASHQRRPQ